MDLKLALVWQVEIVNAFEGEEGLKAFKEWVMTPDKDVLAEAQRVGGKGRKNNEAASQEGNALNFQLPPPFHPGSTYLIDFPFLPMDGGLELGQINSEAHFLLNFTNEFPLLGPHPTPLCHRACSITFACNTFSSAMGGIRRCIVQEFGGETIF